MAFAKEFARRVNAVTAEKMGGEAVHIAKRAVADTLGVMIAGCRESFIDALESVLGAEASDGAATRIGRGGKSTALHAALINGTSAHALDFDDCSTTMGGHPSAPVLPALLALGEERRRSGAEVIEAFLAGFECETRLARGVMPVHYEKGWHPTATLGIFGATAACARLLQFSEDAMANALAIAASQAGGLKSNFGTPVKPLHVGQAAHNGLFAVLLTERGLAANPAALEHAHGFFRVFNGEDTYSVEKILDDWDGTPEILSPGIAIKQHPCCGSAHSAIDAAIALREKHGPFAADDIACIETWTHERRLAHTNRPAPGTALDAKFSVQFLTAKALISGAIRLGDFEDGRFMTAAIEPLLARVTSRAHHQADQYLGRVRVTLRDGRVLEDTASTNLGRGPLNPMTDDALQAKFLDCVAPRYDAPHARALFADVLAMDRRQDIGELVFQFG